MSKIDELMKNPPKELELFDFEEDDFCGLGGGVRFVRFSKGCVEIVYDASMEEWYYQINDDYGYTDIKRNDKPLFSSEYFKNLKELFYDFYINGHVNYYTRMIINACYNKINNINTYMSKCEETLNIIKKNVENNSIKN